MADRYTAGPSTPRPIRYNDQLWADFILIAKRRQLTAAQVLRELMIKYLTDQSRELISALHFSQEKDAGVEVDLSGVP